MCNGGNEDRPVQPCGGPGASRSAQLKSELSSWPEAQLAIALALLPDLKGYLPFMRREPCHPRMLANLSDELSKVTFFSVVPREQQMICCEMCFLYPGDEAFESQPGLFGRQDATLKPGDTLIVPPTKVLFVSAGMKLEGIMMKMLPADLGPQSVLEPVGFFPMQCALERLPEEGLKLAAEVKDALPHIQCKALPRREAKALETRRQERSQGKAADSRQERRAPAVRDDENAAAAERAAARAEAELLLELEKEEAEARRKLALKQRRRERKRNMRAGEALSSEAPPPPVPMRCNPQGSPDVQPPEGPWPGSPFARRAGGNPQSGPPGSSGQDQPSCGVDCQEVEPGCPPREKRQERVSEAEAAAREATWRRRKQSSWTPDLSSAPVARTFIHFGVPEGAARRSRSA